MKKFFANFFTTGLLWFAYAVTLFIIYFIHCALESSQGYIGLRIVDLERFKANIAICVVASILLVLLLIGAFFIGQKVLADCRNSVLTAVSCFVPYLIIIICIWNSNILVEFTKSYLSILLPVIGTRISDFSPPINDAEYIIWQTEYFNRSSIYYELVSSPWANALFALFPFLIAYIGFYTKKKKTGKRSGDGYRENRKNTGDG